MTRSALRFEAFKKDESGNKQYEDIREYPFVNLEDLYRKDGRFKSGPQIVIFDAFVEYAIRGFETEIKMIRNYKFMPCIKGGKT